MLVLPLTTTRRGLSLHVEVEATVHTGLDSTRYVQCELIRSINRNRLLHHLGAIGPDISTQITTVINTLLNHDRHRGVFASEWPATLRCESTRHF